jgi:hypothetical protein
MDLYVLLSKLAENSTMGEPDKVAAREVIRNLKGVNAFGTVVAGTESESKEIPHVHKPQTQWHKYEPSKLVDVCLECGDALTPPYDPKFQGRKW